MRKILSKFLMIIMLFTLFPTSVLAQTITAITNDYNDLAINYVQFDRLDLTKAEISTTGNIKVSRGTFPQVQNGKTPEDGLVYPHVVIYYEGPLTWGTANRTATENAKLGITSVNGSITMRFPKMATLSDGTKADILIDISDIKVGASAKPETIDNNTKVFFPLINSGIVVENPPNFQYICGGPRTVLDDVTSTLTRAQFTHTNNTTIKVVKPGTTTPIDTSKYPTMLFGAYDLDVQSADIATGKESSEQYAGLYSEGFELLSGFNSPLYLTENTLCVVETVNGNTKIRGTMIDGSTTNSGFVASANPAGFSVKWSGSQNSSATIIGSTMGTTLSNFANVAVTATSGEGGSIEKSGNTSYLINSQI